MFLSFLLPLTIRVIATTIDNPITTTPVIERIIFLNIGFSVPPNVVSIVVSSVSIDTAPDIREMLFAVEYTGLWYFLYLIKFIIAKLKVVNV